MKEGGGEEGNGGQQHALCLTKNSLQLLSLLGSEEGKGGKEDREREEEEEEWGGKKTGEVR